MTSEESVGATELEFGSMLPVIGPSEVCNPEAHRQLADELEEQGFDIAVVPGHIVLPESLVNTEYPYSPDGECPYNMSDDIFESFTTLAHLAGVTDELRLGTNVCVIPQRNPLLLTRQLVDLVAISEDRFELGAGVGWAREEFDALDVPFEERGGRTDEFFEILGRACSEGAFSFDGEYHSFDRLSFYPTPPNGRPPVWIGGDSGAAFRRVGEFGDGWTSAWARPDKIASSRDRIMNAWRDYERKGVPGIAITRPVHVGTDTTRSTDRPFIGDPESIVDDIREYIDAGVTRVYMDFYTKNIDEQLEQVRRFGEQVLPAFR